MMTVNEVSKLTGVSIRTLQYYDRIGLLKPAKYTEAGYRLYDKKAMETLQQITLLTMKKEHLENLICFAREIQVTGVKTMDFSVFDTKKMNEYARQAKEQWGKTAEFKEFEQKSQSRSKEEEQAVYRNFMQLFTDFGKLKDGRPESADVQSHVKKLQDYITEHFYQCSKDILFSLGQMYAAGGEFTTNIDRAGGEGTAEFVACAIRVYCGK